jgi:ribosomal protein S27AE
MNWGNIMPEFVTLTCPSCGGKLQITPDLDRFACGYCGAEHVVKRGGGIVALEPIVHGLKQVQAGVDRTASELAIKRLKEKKYDLQIQRQNFINEGLENKSIGFTTYLIIFGLICLPGGAVLFLAYILTGMDLLIPLIIFISGTCALILGIVSERSNNLKEEKLYQAQQKWVNELDTQIASTDAS